MGRFFGPIRELRLLVSYSFLKMLLLLLVGSLVNTLFIFYYGFGFSVWNQAILPPLDWTLYWAWVVLYPVAWAAIATYMLPVKLRASPFDLQITTGLLLFAVYGSIFGLTGLSPAIYNSLIPIIVSIVQTPIMAYVIGEGTAGEPSYEYDSFLIKGKSLADYKEFYGSERYRSWVRLPHLIVVKDIKTERGLTADRVVLHASSDSDIGAFVFLFNSREGLHIQSVCFERGKYWIFNSDRSRFFASQLKRTILNDMKAEAAPFLDEVERENALRFALSETRSVAALRGLDKRDRVILAIGAVALGIVLYGTLLLDWNKENAIGLGLLIVIAVAAELSYRKFGMSRLLRGPSSH